MLRRCSFHLNITLPKAIATNATLDLQLEGGNCLQPLGSLLSETSFGRGKPPSILTRVWNHPGWQVANVVLLLKLNLQSQKPATLRKWMLGQSSFCETWLLYLPVPFWWLWEVPLPWSAHWTLWGDLTHSLDKRWTVVGYIHPQHFLLFLIISSTYYNKDKGQDCTMVGWRDEQEWTHNSSAQGITA